MKKRYAQLQAQLAIVQANLSARYGEQYEQVKDYLDEAKTWYEKAKEDPEIVTEKVSQTRNTFEQKLGEAGSAIAQKEQKIKHRLRELWDSLSESFNRSKPVDSPKALEGENPKLLEGKDKSL
jgi:alpha-L-arabinofuranosidase